MTKPLVVIDGAHNADGIDTLVSSLQHEYPTTKWNVVFGVMGDKNTDKMIESLLQVADGFVVTAARSERATRPEALALSLAEQTDLPVLISDDVAHAVDMARAEAGEAGSVLVTGSLYVVGEARAHIV